MIERVTNKDWFEVDVNGLKQLQAGKPKHYLVRELVQNAWDEKVSKVKLFLKFGNPISTISVEDDSKEGFKDLKDSYTLYKETSKRTNPEQRGRFNLGEKQAFSICESAVVSTTKGTITFDKNGRTETTEKRKSGSLIVCKLKMTKKEFDEMYQFVQLYIVPNHIEFYINGVRSTWMKVRSFTTKLTTELSDGEVMRPTIRLTKVNLYKTDKSYLYEMGIPVTEIECEWSIDVQQKIPLGVDRETIPQSYLRDLFSEVLNNTFDIINEDNSSQQWIREGMSDERVSKEAVDTILEKRFGEKVCVADTFDKNSVDEALAHGYRVIRGNELSKEEWSNVRKFESLSSSSNLFGTHYVDAKPIKPNEEQLIVADYAKKLASRLLNISINVQFVSHRDMVAAEFGSLQLTFNVAKLGKKFFENKLETTGLILHEIAHYKGNHTEHSYHECLTKMAQDLVILALNEPRFFN